MISRGSFHGNPKSAIGLCQLSKCTCTLFAVAPAWCIRSINSPTDSLLTQEAIFELEFIIMGLFIPVCVDVCEPDSTWPFDNAHHSWYSIVEELRSQTFNKTIYSITTHRSGTVEFLSLSTSTSSTSFSMVLFGLFISVSRLLFITIETGKAQ